jgi:hypothetical protein
MGNRHLSSVAAVLCSAGLAAAQTPPASQARNVTPDESEASPETPIRFTLGARTTFGFNADFDDAPGDLSVSRVLGELGASIPAGERAQVQVQLDYEFSHYDFNDATGFVAGTETPFEDVHRSFLNVRYVRQQTRQFVWYAGGLIGFGAEDGADLSESVEGGIFGGVRFYLSERFSIGAGLIAVTQLEDDPLIIPTALFEWHFAPGWSIGSGGRPGLTLGYEYSDQLQFALSAFYESRDFRLDEDGPIPDGVARERQVPVAFTVEYRPNPQFSVGAALGVNFARNYEIMDSHGDEIADIDADPAPFLRFLFTYAF